MSQLMQACSPTTPDELVDSREVAVDKALPKEERIAAFLHQIKNPYRFHLHSPSQTNPAATVDHGGETERFQIISALRKRMAVEKTHVAPAGVMNGNSAVIIAGTVPPRRIHPHSLPGIAGRGIAHGIRNHGNLSRLFHSGRGII